MNRRGAIASALSTAVIVVAMPAASAAQPAPERPAERRSVAPAGAGAQWREPCTGAYQGDARLGPERLPRLLRFPVGPLVFGYQRTGKLSPDAFLRKYWEGPADKGGWKYPPNDGFAEVNGKVDKRRAELRPGQRLDRFGSEYGGYLAPAGDHYAKRALPPQNLNTRDAAFPCDYHVYEVTRKFTVWQGGIAPWFEQPGGGQQIKLDPALLNPGQGQRLNVKWLLDNGYLAAARR
ncbi:TNT domain-containing protein [Streptomyces sp. AC563]|uniref:TNT domain-containing protein n=1 Tax=Streptomyces buecherae TaxID=2763006 RepID=UPI00164D180F|nr:TNT domain-containing protein [Streptomyces buecherae]MBC3992581.1 TNT domain-containing protein [Streptomyces buecherae]